MRYEVWTHFRGRTGQWVIVEHTDTYNEAVDACNSWDEKQDTYLLDTQRLDFYDHKLLANMRFDNAIARLESQKEYMPKLRALIDRPSPFVKVYTWNCEE